MSIEASVALAQVDNSSAVPTLCAKFQENATGHPEQVALSAVDGSSPDITWGEYADKVREAAGVLAYLGVKPGDAVALLLNTRAEFHWFDTAALHLGASPFSIYNTAPPAFVDHVLSNSGARVLITERAYLEQAVRVAPQLEQLIIVDGDPGDRWSYCDVAGSAPEDFDFESRWRAVESDDIATIIYTSGTTGVSKGVELTHANLWHAVNTYMQQTGVPKGAHQLSFLPMAHMAARFMDHYSQIIRDFRLSLVASPSKVESGLLIVRPTMFFSTPRVWEKLRAAINARIDGESDPEKKDQLRDALDRSIERVTSHGSAGGERPGDSEALLELRGAVGLDHIVSAVVGGAPFQRSLMEFYHAIGVPLAESYGLSENTGCCATNPPDDVRFGTVGKPLAEQEVKLAGDGEILIRGPFVMRGYRGMPEATAEALDSEGWLRTGDIGSFDADGYLSVVDRKKELIINAAGKNMAPALIQGEIIKHGRLVSTAVAVGDGRPYNVAVLVLDVDAAQEFCRAEGIDDMPRDVLVRDERILAVVEEDVATANENLSRVEQIKKFHLIADDWAPGGSELTATMKVRRAGVIGTYAKEIEGLYSS